MKHAFPMFALGLALGGVGGDNELSAQPVETDWGSSPLCLSRESLLIGVGRELSSVQGDFEFTYVPDLDTQRRTLVHLQFPVVVSASVEDFHPLQTEIQMNLTVGSASFEPESYSEFTPPELATIAALLEDAKIVLFNFRLPRTIFKTRFNATLSYVQPHHRLHGKDVLIFVPYLPCMPRLENPEVFPKRDFSVSLGALDGLTLERVSGHTDVLEDVPARLTLRPKHLEPIVVTVAEPKESPATPQ